jgi:hypothetical protein
MANRVLILGAVILIFAAALVVNLWIVDVVTLPALKESLGRIFSIVAVTTGATMAIIYLTKLAMKK